MYRYSFSNWFKLIFMHNNEQMKINSRNVRVWSGYGNINPFTTFFY